MNKCTKLSADWNIFRYRNGYTFFVTDSQIHTYGLIDSWTHKHFSHWSFHNPETLNNLQKKIFKPIGGKKVMELDTIIHPSCK